MEEIPITPFFIPHIYIPVYIYKYIPGIIQLTSTELEIPITPFHLILPEVTKYGLPRGGEERIVVEMGQPYKMERFKRQIGRSPFKLTNFDLTLGHGVVHARYQ